MKYETLTVMFTDIKDFTSKTSLSSRENFEKMLSNHEKILTPVFKFFGGRLIKSIGDAFLVTFASPTDALICGVMIQAVLRQYNNVFPPDQRIELRIALNLGEVEVKKDDVFGDPVNIASRLQSAAEVGEVYFTESVFLAMNRAEISAIDLGEKIFKGISFPVKVYKVDFECSKNISKKYSNSLRFSTNGVQIRGTKLGGPRIKPSVLYGILLIVTGSLAAAFIVNKKISTSTLGAKAVRFSAANLQGYSDNDNVRKWDSDLRTKVSATAENESEGPLYQTKNGIRSLLFNGSSNFMRADDLARIINKAKGITAVYVARTDSLATQYVLTCTEKLIEKDVLRFGFNKGMIRFGSSNKQHIDVENDANLSSFSVYSFVVDSDFVSIFLNGKKLKSEYVSKIPFSKTAHCSLGQDWDGNSYIDDAKPSDFFEGELAEISIYFEALDNQRRSQIESELIKKFSR